MISGAMVCFSDIPRGTHTPERSIRNAAQATGQLTQVCDTQASNSHSQIIKLRHVTSPNIPDRTMYYTGAGATAGSVSSCAERADVPEQQPAEDAMWTFSPFCS